MITLSILTIIWFIVSTTRLYIISKKTKEDFNPLNGTFIDYAGFIFGASVCVMVIIFLFHRYLP